MCFVFLPLLPVACPAAAAADTALSSEPQDKVTKVVAKGMKDAPNTSNPASTGTASSKTDGKDLFPVS